MKFKLKGSIGVLVVTIFIIAIANSNFAIGDLTTATSIDLNSLDRGTHNVRASVQDAEGRLILDSKTTTFHILRHSVQHP